MTGSSMTLADRLQEATEQYRAGYRRWAYERFVSGLSAEIVAALRDRDRLREAAEAVVAEWEPGKPYFGHHAQCPEIRFPGSYMEPPDPCTCGRDTREALRAALSQPSPSSEEAPAP